MPWTYMVCQVEKDFMNDLEKYEIDLSNGGLVR